jgi:hypothetical protein
MWSCCSVCRSFEAAGAGFRGDARRMLRGGRIAVAAHQVA